MWIFTKHGFASVAKHHSLPNMLIVRSPFKGDLERLFAKFDVSVYESQTSDYRYRCVVRPSTLKSALADSVDGIEYAKVKPAIDRPDDADGGDIRHESHLSIFNSLLQAGCDLAQYQIKKAQDEEY